MLLLRPLITCVHQPAQLRLKLWNTSICCLRSQFTWSKQPRKFSPLKKAALTTVLSATCFVGFYRVHINYGPPQDPSAQKISVAGGKEIQPFILFFRSLYYYRMWAFHDFLSDNIGLIKEL